jgi:short-subunit dehydrogenase
VKPSQFGDKYGPWAVIAGASEGLGAEFARQIAARGLHVVLVDVAAELLGAVASEIRAAYQVDVREVVVDLVGADLNLARSLGDGVEVGLFVYNAAFSPIGRFVEQDLADKLRALDVNCRAPLVLTHEFAASMAARGRGGIVLMSSMSGFHGTAMVATYAATKAFNLVLAESLWAELSDRGVDVLACCPGPTRTPGFEKSNPKGGPTPMDPRAVVEETLLALGARPSHVPGFTNRLAEAFMCRVLGRKSAAQVISGATRRMYDG